MQMNAVFEADDSFGGALNAISSKSELHRMVIAAALSGQSAVIDCRSDSLDVDATLGCAAGLGMISKKEDNKITLESQNRIRPGDTAEFYCGESGSTLRFMLPIAAALGLDSTFKIEPGLARRPHSALCELLSAHGVEVYLKSNAIITKGRLRGGEYRLPGNISSQYVTGLLFALPMADSDSRIIIDGSLASQPYVDMTLKVISSFGVRIDRTDNGYYVPAGQTYKSPGTLAAGGDWSNAASVLCMGAFSEKGVACRGINPSSEQGDKAIADYLVQFGAQVKVGENSTSVSSNGRLTPAEIDLTNTPDLALSVGMLAAAAEGVSVILGTDRLKYKESDRRLALCNTVNALGGRAEIGNDRITVRGRGRLVGGSIPSFGDHRVVMAAATASVASKEPTVVEGADAVSKSYKSFFEDYAALGGKVTTVKM